MRGTVEFEFFELSPKNYPEIEVSMQKVHFFWIFFEIIKITFFKTRGEAAMGRVQGHAPTRLGQHAQQGMSTVATRRATIDN